MSDVAQPTAAFVDDEPPEVLGRNLAAAARLLASASAFFFLAFVFAYFYLRSLNNGGMWKPKGVDPSVGLGVGVLVAVVACAALVRLALSDESGGKVPAARLKLAVALGAGVVAIVLQIVMWFTEGFGPTEGGYASVLIGWTGVFALFVLIALVWLEMSLATMIRSGAGPEAAGSAQIAGAELDALSFFWTFLAGVGVVTFVILYLV
jgi:heme/copper-type cytochrome/quinol oxidase subunit 3